MMRFFKGATLSLASASLIASPAFAGESEHNISIAFTYNAEARAEANYKELRREVRRACRSADFMVSPVFARDARKECRGQLMDKAVAATKQPKLIAMHAQLDARRVAQVASR